MSLDRPEWKIVALLNKLLETNAVLIEAYVELQEYQKMLCSVVGDTHRWKIQDLRSRIVATICKKPEGCE